MSIYDSAKVFGPALVDKFKNPIKATLERFTTASDGQGGQNESWATLVEFDIAILPGSGGDGFKTDRIESNTPVIAYAKYSDISVILAGDRVVHDGVIYRLEDNLNIAKAGAVIKLILNDGLAA